MTPAAAAFMFGAFIGLLTLALVGIVPWFLPLMAGLVTIGFAIKGLGGMNMSEKTPKALPGSNRAVRGVSLADSLRQNLQATIGQWHVRDLVKARGWTDEIERQAGLIVGMASGQVAAEEANPGA